MKANQHARENEREGDDKAQVGIGTMIVFIAAVIVAAVAAAVLINVAGNLQRKASETGQEATQEVAANLFLRDIVGTTNASQTGLSRIAWYMSLAPGAEPIDLNTTVLRWKSASDLSDMQVSSFTDCTDAAFDALADGFCVRNVYDAGDGDYWVLSEGDRVRIEVALGTGEELAPRTSVDVLFLLEAGSPVTGSFKTPATFGKQTYVGLT